MYKYLLCWRYLRTRYIALASIISVMLGVATMIVVNSVMAGFAEKMRDRLHGVLADVVVEANSFDGFHAPEEVEALIRETLGDRVAATARTVETYALMTVTVGSQSFQKQVQLIGIRPEERAKLGDFAEYLIDEKGRAVPPSFEVSDRLRRASSPAAHVLGDGTGDPDFDRALMQDALVQVPDLGAVVGYAAATIHLPGTNKDAFIAPMGANIVLTCASAGRPPKAASNNFTVVGFFKSGMSEYDSTHVYVPLDVLQRMRAIGGIEGRGAVNQIQVKVRPGVDIDEAARTLEAALFRKWPMRLRVETWEQKQGPLLSAVQVEQNILNMLLFFIIAVAGFGILAIFSMIVVEKTRDIGILKALGASTAGVRGIFLGYGLSLGLVGSGVGMAGGLLFVHYINDFEALLSRLTGRKVFDGDIYYFNEIPTLVQTSTVLWIVGGALFIAVAASVWPAQRAARMHPVRALRNE